MWNSAKFTEAFEGPVDVANRVAELLMLRMGSLECMAVFSDKVGRPAAHHAVTTLFVMVTLIATARTSILCAATITTTATTTYCCYWCF